MIRMRAMSLAYRAGVTFPWSGGHNPGAFFLAEGRHLMDPVAVTPAPSLTEAGESTVGKYRLIASLGHGGMADVFLVVVPGPAGFNKLQVVKRLRSGFADDPEHVSMFLDEARLAARLNHPNVVQTFEVSANLGEYF